MAGEMLNKGVVLRTALVLALGGAGFGVWDYVQNIQAGARVNLALREAFAGAVEVADPDRDPDAMILGQPDMVSKDIWMGCADFEPMSYAARTTLTEENPPAADDLGWQSPVDVAFYAERGWFDKLTLVQASVAVLGSDVALADVIDPVSGAMVPAVVERLRAAGFGPEYDRMLAGLSFAMVQQLGCPGFTVFQIEGK
jgi:hypothetical protein